MDNLARQLIILIEKFRNDLRQAMAHLQRFLDRHADATEKTVEAQQENAETYALILSRIGRDALFLKGRTRQPNRDPLSWVKLSIELATLVVVAAYTSLTAYQLVQVTIGTETARETMLRSERPWLAEDGQQRLTIDKVFEDGMNGGFSFQVKNFGPSPALSVGQAIRPFVRNHTDSSDFDEARKQACQEADTVAIIAGNSVFPQQGHTYSTSGAFHVPGIRREGMILVAGCLAYADQFDPEHTVHHTSFCIMGEIKKPSNLYLCGHHELAD